MDTRYRDRGYSVKLVENEAGAYLAIFRNGRRVGDVSIGVFSGISDDSPVEVTIRRLRRGELRDVTVADEFPADVVES